MVIKDLKMNLQIEELKAFLQTVQKNNVTIFECLFSDLHFPTNHVRRSIKSTKKSVNEKPELSIKEYLDEIEKL